MQEGYKVATSRKLLSTTISPSHSKPPNRKGQQRRTRQRPNLATSTAHRPITESARTIRAISFKKQPKLQNHDSVIKDTRI